MENSFIKHILSFIILLLNLQYSIAQDYVVTTKGDTLKGTVKLMNFGVEKQVQVVGIEKKKTKIPILQVRIIKLKDDIYNPVRNEKGYVFMKLLTGGYLSLYAFQLENQVNYDGLYLVKRDGHSMEVPNLSFKKMVSKFLQDCSLISEKVDNGTWHKKDIYEIVNGYNECIDEKTMQTKAIIDSRQKKMNVANSWSTLEEKIKSQPDFDGKANALEMVNEIKIKINRQEKIPNFLIEGLKNSLSSTGLKDDVDILLKEPD